MINDESTHFIYDVERFVSRQTLTQITVENSRNPDILARETVIRAIRRVAAYRPKETLVVRWPATWWQHFKLRFFTSRMKRIWPVLYHTETYQAIAYLPSVPVAKPEWRDTMFYGWEKKPEIDK